MQPSDPIDSRPDDDAGPPELTSGGTAPDASLDEVAPQNTTYSAPLGPRSLASITVQRERSRWWTPIAITAVSLIVFIFFSTLMAIVALYVVHGRIDMALLHDTDSFLAVSQSRVGLFLLVVIPQLTLVTPAIAAAFLSPVETRERLSLVRGHWPMWAWFGAALATPLVGLISSVVVGQFMEESESLKTMTDIFRDHGESGFLIPLALMIGLTPAICEEILFRGYVQTRLTRSFGPISGIFFASFIFAAFHFDYVHVIAVFPLGLFLGLITWRSGSLFPAMIGHLINNVISVVAVVVAPAENTDVLDAPSAIFSLSILIFGIMGFACVFLAWTQYGSAEANAKSALAVADEKPTTPFA